MILSKFSKSFQGGNVILPYDIYNVRVIPSQKSLKTLSIISEVHHTKFWPEVWEYPESYAGNAIPRS